MVLPRLFLFSERRFHVVPVRKCSPKTFLIYVIIRENFAKFSRPRSGCFPPKSFAFRLCNRPSSPPLRGRASPRGKAAKRLTIFAKKMKFTEFFSGKGKPMKEANFNLSSLGAARHSPQKGKARGRGIYGIILRCFKAARISANISSLLFLPSTTMKRSLFSRACFKKPRYTLS